MTETVSVFEIVPQEDWSSTPDKDLLFSSDHVIDAYFKGHSDGINSENKLKGDQIRINVNRAGQIAKDIIAMLETMGVNAESAFLKIPHWQHYYIMIVVPNEAIIGDGILDIYSNLADIELNSKSDYFSLSISLCAGGETFSEKCLVSDGYNLKYTVHNNE